MKSYFNVIKYSGINEHVLCFILHARRALIPHFFNNFWYLNLWTLIWSTWYRSFCFNTKDYDSMIFEFFQKITVEYLAGCAGIFDNLKLTFIGWFFQRRDNSASIATTVPVRPIPAEQCIMLVEVWNSREQLQRWEKEILWKFIQAW